MYYLDPPDYPDEPDAYCIGCGSLMNVDRDLCPSCEAAVELLAEREEMERVGSVLARLPELHRVTIPEAA